ncbi:hypothetical protein YH65_06255 [Sulfurovum lithotrophicum]|uniref:diguanylate cyclase n=2 Tax=Sulfurovum lithotrophicum TaxID=206403 RepID=A0A7U4M352_9BACT|nr:hypothetical protein YH65_06255 [Sulfurovum lithotrophicum]
MLVQKIKSLEEEIELNRSFLEMLFDAIPNPIFYKDNNGVYRHGNEAFSKTILGLHKDEITGKSLYDFPDRIPKELANIYYAKDRELLETPGTQNYEAEVKCADNTVRHYNFYKATFISQSNEVLGIVGVMLDISEHKKAIKELDEKNTVLNNLSITDPLTLLYNRRHFQEIFERKTSMLIHHHQPFALLLIDIDFFKDYNDSFGHKKGDDVLQNISNVLRRSFSRPIDFVFRLGGEEFGVLFNYTEVEQAVYSAKKLLNEIEDLDIPAANTAVSHSITVSAGLGLINCINDVKSSLNYHYDEIDKLLYHAKKNGRNQFSYKIYD